MTQPDPAEKESITSLTSEFEHAALRHGVTLSPLRISKLVRLARAYSGQGPYGTNGSHQDLTTGIIVGKPGDSILQSDGTYFQQEGTAKIHFVPTVDEGELAGAAPEYATRIVHNALTGLQDYVLLVEAGYLERPAILRGGTNPQMAKLAERVGFVPVGTVMDVHNGGEKTIVTAPFEVVSQQIFSEEALRLEEVLVKRLMSEGIGNTALSG